MCRLGTETGRSGRRGGCATRAGRACSAAAHWAGGVAVGGAATSGGRRQTPGHSRPAGTTRGRCEQLSSTGVTTPHCIYIDAPHQRPEEGLCTTRPTRGGPPANSTTSRARRAASPHPAPPPHTLATASSHLPQAPMAVTTPTGVS